MNEIAIYIPSCCCRLVGKIEVFDSDGNVSSSRDVDFYQLPNDSMKLTFYSLNFK